MLGAYKQRPRGQRKRGSFEGSWFKPNRWSNDEESKLLEIIAKDTINLSEDSVGNDLKGVSGVPTRTR